MAGSIMCSLFTTVFCLALFANPSFASNDAVPPKKPYDHQTKAYMPTHDPVSITDVEISAKGFFSPDHSADTLVELINAANKTLDIATPGVSSWIGCSYAKEGGCAGCDVKKQNMESFPIFNATLNALHRGVRVRLLTNNYETKVCAGKIDPLTFLALAGVNVTFYASTSFMHAKYMQVDGKIVSISSVNWSHNSYTNNREAGMVLSSDEENGGVVPLIKMTTAVFEDDLSLGQSFNTSTSKQYSMSDLAIIRNNSTRNVTLPGPAKDRKYYSPKPEPVTAKMGATVFTSPDDALNTLTSELSKAQTSIEIYIYQINDDEICDLLQTKSQLVDITLLVSPQILDSGDQSSSFECYNKLILQGLTVNMAHQYNKYFYTHNKYWIIDGKEVGVSTGNWAPTDFPEPAESYPPYGEADWVKTNRDFTVIVQNQDIAKLFQEVLQGDMKNSFKYSINATGSCKRYGCGTYDPTYACQCNAQCEKYNNCCLDYSKDCQNPNYQCDHYGCNSTYNADQSCQCNPDCWKFNDCCADYNSLCQHHESTTSAPYNKHMIFNGAVAIAIIGSSVFIVIAALIGFFFTRYTSQRRKITKSSDAVKAPEPHLSMNLGTAPNEINDKKAPLLRDA